MRRLFAPPRRWLVSFATALLLLAVALTARPLGAQTISVSPDGSNVVQPVNNYSASQVFGVSGLVSGQTYFRDITCTGQVTSCGSSTPQSFTAPLFALTVNYSTMGAGAGKILVRVYGNGLSDTGWVNVAVDNTKPTIQRNAPLAFFATPTPTIQFTWCDSLGLNSSSRTISVNGFDKTSSFDYVTVAGAPNTGCAVKATSTTNAVALNMGNNTVVTHICDAVALCTDSTFTLVRTTNGLAIRSELSARQNFTGSTGNLQRFYVKNTQSGPVTFTISCAATGTVSSPCTAKQGSLTLQPGESVADTASYNIGATAGAGTVVVKATDGTFTDSATIAVTAIAAPAPLVSVLEMNPGTNLDRSRCLKIAVAKHMANECGDLRMVHPLPSMTTFGRTRTPTLLYSSASADPVPIVAASVTLPTVTCPTSDSVEAVLKVNGVVRVSATRWSVCNWSTTSTSTRRIGVGYNASGDSTGVYDYTLDVTRISGAARSTTTVSGKLVVVNRNSSAFGAGWWLAGLERLVTLPDGSKLWVGGDGSVRVYSSAGVYKWVAPPDAGPDTLTYDTLTTYYTRSLKGGTKIKFNSVGQHVLTVNRLGQQTGFTYSGGRLATITPPVIPGFPQTYNFNYNASNQLTSVVAPQTRTVTLWPNSATARVDSIADPDASKIRFTYVNGTTRKIVGRKNKLLVTTEVSYEVEGHVYRANTPLVGDSIRHGFTDVSLRGYYNWWLGKTAYDTALAGTQYRQPRTYAGRASDTVTQQPVYFLKGDGSVRKINDAAHKNTHLAYEDAQWPALVTQVIDPTGFKTKASYDGRGNLIRSTAVNPLGTVPATDAVTAYEWDPVWDAVTTVHTPTGLVTTMAYDATNGNRLWQQVGTDVQRRVTYGYGNSQKLPSSVTQQGVQLDSMEYDPQWNLAHVRNANGYWTSSYKDFLGRDTLVVTPISSGDKSYGDAIVDALNRVRSRVVWTVMDRDSVSETIGPSIVPSQLERVYARTLYDAEGNKLSLARIAYPDTAHIDTVTTSWQYDKANRRVAEIAPLDLKVDSTLYDPNGNVVSVMTRRRNPSDTTQRLNITMTYDVMDRLVTRVLPSLTYPSRPTNFKNVIAAGPLAQDYGVYTIPSETHQFSYDDAGRLLKADNADALVRRTYYPNGQLKTDVLKIQTVARNDTLAHVYAITHTYDLDGRQTKLGIPRQLGPTAADTIISYSYVPETGQLQTLAALQGNTYTYGYDLKGQLTSVTYPGWYTQSLSYDVDGRVVGDTIFNLNYLPNYQYNMPGNPVRASVYSWDARDKLLTAGDAVRFRDTVTTTYSGLGNVATSTWVQTGCSGCDLTLPAGYRHIKRESYTADALGNRTQSAVNDTTWGGGNVGTNGPVTSAWLSYQPRTGRLQGMLPNGGVPQLNYFYDEAGNQIFSSAFQSNQQSSETASFYSADGKLRMVDTRSANPGLTPKPQKYALEDYRYDALGRRVWVRAQKWCDRYGVGVIFWETECRTGLIRRTVWDGNTELAEIQMPWALENGNSGGAITVQSYPQFWENDTLPVSLPALDYGNGVWGDPNPLFGRVVYAGRSGIDQPVAVTRMNYTWKRDWFTSVTSTGWINNATTTETPLTFTPFWSITGEAPQGVSTAGTLTRCTPLNSTTACVGIQWPWDMSAWDREGLTVRGSWHGTLLESKRDKSGFGFMRNRYYDPGTGRFTQEDPIGLAGGLNVYGFASGDPVNFSDPLGLCPEEMKNDAAACEAWNQAQVGEANDIVIDEFASGNQYALGAGDNESIKGVNEDQIEKLCGKGTVTGCSSSGGDMVVNADRNPAAISGTIVHERQHIQNSTDKHRSSETCARWRAVHYVEQMSGADYHSATSGHIPAYTSTAGTDHGCF